MTFVVQSPPNPDDFSYRSNPLLYSRAVFGWMNDLKGKLERSQTISNGVPVSSPKAGMIPYRTPTAWLGLSPGTAGQKLIQGTSTSPTWGYNGNKIGFSARAATAGTATSSAYSKVPFDTEDFDPNGNFDNTSNYRYTAPVTGYYHVNLSVGLDSVADGKLIAAAIFRNGTSVKQGGNTTGAATTGLASVSALLSLSAADYIEGFVYNGDASNRTVNVDPLNSHFSAFLTEV